MKDITPLLLAACSLASSAFAAELHVSPSGAASGDGSRQKPFATISAASNKAMPGDTVTVHAGIYRERVDPPRGGESDGRRIVYQAAPGEKVVVTGAEVVKGWEHVGNDTWKVTLPSRFFGDYNPFGDLVSGDYFISQGHPNHTGAVYLDGAWLTEVYAADQVLSPASGPGRWFATAPGKSTAPLMNLAWFSTGGEKERVAAISAGAIGNLQRAESVEGGGCLGYIHDGSWATYKDVPLAGVTKLRFRVSSDSKAGVPGSRIEVRLDSPLGELLGTATVPATKDWQTWETVGTAIKPTAGTRTLALVFKDKPVDPSAGTTLWAQFKGADPNDRNVEVNVRSTVFSPSKTGIDYITVRGFTLRQAATQWAPPTAGQIGIISAYWNKGWIIENNEISHSICAGVALGKYSAPGDNFAGNNSQVYTTTIDQALANGWSKDKVGHHIVRNNHIHHCEQNAVVGSMGCAFSQVTGNEIHDIYTRKLFSGFEMAGIKFHGFIDGVIRDNHIYNCGCLGIWLDWMCQGAQVTGNLIHDNGDSIFLEMQHGPILLANNIMMSGGNSIYMNSKSMAFAHNLITGGTTGHQTDERRTPYHKPHSTEVVALHDSPGGDHRFYNNLFTTRANTAFFDKSPLPSVAGGNVYTKGAQPAKFDPDSLVKSDFDPKPKLTRKADGWYLSLNEDSSWKSAQPRKLVTTQLLGLAKIPNLPYENADGSPLAVGTDYFGKKRDTTNPFPGPFEAPATGEIKVWPK